MSDDQDIATKKLNEVREKAAEKFSNEEINSFITAGKQLASKAVLSMLVCLIKEGPSRGLDQAESNRLCKKIERVMPYNYCGYTSISFNETSYILNICLSLVEQGYKTDISIPSNSYAKDLFAQYNFLKKIAVAYWQQFTEEQPALVKRISEYMRDVDFSELKIDKENPTVMYFDSKSKKYVGIFCYYTDPQGRPVYKKK